MNPKVVRSGDTFAMPVPGTNIVFVFDAETAMAYASYGRSASLTVACGAEHGTDRVEHVRRAPRSVPTNEKEKKP